MCMKRLLSTRFFLLLFTFHLVICFTIGCAGIRKLSDIKWTGNNTGISEKIENKGYYKSSPNELYGFIFYDDGTIVVVDTPTDSVLSIEGSYYDEDDNQWDLGYTGVYKIKGDTIHANVYRKNGFYLPSGFPIISWIEMMSRFTFRILDREKILWIDKHLLRDREFPDPEIVNDTLFFEPVSPLPPPNTEMKKKRWLWKKDD